MRSGGERSERRARLARFRSQYVTALRSIGPHHDAHWPALRVGICVAIPLSLTVGLGHPEWAPYAVFGALGSLFGRRVDYPTRLRVQAIMGVCLSAAVVTGTAVGIVAPASLLAVAAMAAASLLGYVLSKTRGVLPIPALFLTLAVGTLSSYPHTTADLPLAVGLSLAAATVSVAVGQAGRRLRRGRAVVPGPPPIPLREVLAVQDRRIGAAVHVLGPLLAGTLATTAGIGHPYWAAVTATVPLAGPNLAGRLARGSLRMAGTFAGVGLAFVLLSADPPVWILVVAVAGLQVVTELFVIRNYGIAVLAITPMSLILTHLGSPGSLERLAGDRVIETVIGAGVGMVLLVAVHPLRRPPRTRR